MEKTTIINTSRYVELLNKERWLVALEAAGLDNWEGVPEAHEIYKEEGKDK